MNKLSIWFKSKTLIFGLIVSILGAIEMSLPNFVDILSPEWYGVTTTIIGIIICVLRFLTNTPVSEPPKDDYEV